MSNGYDKKEQKAMTDPVAASQAYEALRHLQREALAKVVAEGYFPLDPKYRECVDNINAIKAYISQKEEKILRLSHALFEIRRCTNVVTDS